MKPEDRTKSAFDYAKESTTQIISLSTGVMALTITFSKDLIGDDKAIEKPIWVLKTAWCLYFLSIVAGVITLLALTGTLSRGPNSLDCKDIYELNVRRPSMVQVIAFMVASAFALAFALLRF